MLIETDNEPDISAKAKKPEVILCVWVITLSVRELTGGVHCYEFRCRFVFRGRIYPEADPYLFLYR
jgi:hypothetical protein